jgi:DNA-binding NarL/FixJ family response regulator
MTRMFETNALAPTVRRALVVEDLTPVRRGLEQLLEVAFPGVAVDAVGSLGQALMCLSHATPYEVALVDLGLPDGNGLDLLAEIRGRHPTTAAIVMTIYDDDERLFHALSLGAQGYLLKDQPTEALIHQLIGLRAGLPPLAPRVTRRILEHLRSPTPPQPAPAAPVARPQRDSEPPLTPRETEVLSLIGRGLQRGEVAHLLGLSENTIAKFIKDIYRKLQISSRAEAALEADRRGLL